MTVRNEARSRHTRGRPLEPEIGKCTRNLKHQLSRGCCGVDRLPIQVQIDAASLQSLDSAEQID